jgi:hypothetical protein
MQIQNSRRGEGERNIAEARRAGVSKTTTREIKAHR